MEHAIHSTSRLFLKRSCANQVHCTQKSSGTSVKGHLALGFVEPTSRNLSLSTISHAHQRRLSSTLSKPSNLDSPKAKIPLPSSTKLRQRFIAPDSQLIFFDECGREDGVPIFFFHGFPACGSEIAAIHSIAWRLGVRLIGPDRPGLGLSSPWRGDRLTKNSDLRPEFFPIHEYPKHIAALAHHLGLRKFGVIGGSGGGPYAVSCANSLQQRIDEYTEADLKQLAKENVAYESISEDSLNSKEKGATQAQSEKPYLAAAAVLAGSGPYAITGTKDMSFTARLTYETVARSTTIGKLMAAFYRRLATKDDGKAFEKGVRGSLKRLSDKDRESVDNDETVESIVHLFKSAFRSQWGVWTEARALLAAKGWGFDLEGIKFTAVDGKGLRLWYGSNDVNTPLSHGRAIASRVPNSVLEIFDGETHYSINDSLIERVLKDILTAMGQDPGSMVQEAEKPPADSLSEIWRLLKRLEDEAGQKQDSSSSLLRKAEV